MDWSGCDLVETIPGKVSGAPIIKHTRIQADAIVENYESGSPIEEISENFGVSDVTIRAILNYAHSHKEQPQP
ncbi:MAG TPA: DUF433 domain-containing protein [Bryobacteraceae bacterium]|jgi:uncharacterized protein (DUF433 family)|nr:DUF433 domain-containing protein [Bryobacteraceae bacterium]